MGVGLRPNLFVHGHMCNPCSIGCVRAFLKDSNFKFVMRVITMKYIFEVHT